MKIYLLDIEKLMILSWEKYFGKEKDVEIIHADFESFMKTHKVDAVVSPANSFGLMDGGYDLAITDWFGESLQKKVQKYIIENYFGEQIVGTSFITDIPGSDVRLIHTPSMRVPDIIEDASVVYQCMRSTLMTALKNGVEIIVIPAFGCGTGMLKEDDVARMMYFAYRQIGNPPKELSWDYAYSTHYKKLW
ncbi:MAG: macro domain-containing protein [Clostridia bacterium]|nr:macro domain-containing protein [Clostridia bacterium]